MKTFIAVCIGTPGAMSKFTELPEAVRAERQTAGISTWHEWVERNKARIVDTGAPLGRTKSISRSGIADIRNNVTAYTVVRADSHEEAAWLFDEGHPHFTIFPGESVEVMECLPIPETPSSGCSLKQCSTGTQRHGNKSVLVRKEL
jgi:hypothetical protein